MKTNKYPDYAEHKRIHDAFVDDVSKFVESHQSGDLASNLVSDVVKKLGEWTRDHIKGMDQKFGAFLQDKI